MSSQTKPYKNASKDSAKSSVGPKPDDWAAASQADETGQQSVIRTLTYLWPYIWPKDRRDLQRRVFIAALFLVFAKLITAATPFFFKHATDALAGMGGTIGTIVGMISRGRSIHIGVSRWAS